MSSLGRVSATSEVHLLHNPQWSQYQSPGSPSIECCAAGVVGGPAVPGIGPACHGPGAEPAGGRVRRQSGLGVCQLCGLYQSSAALTSHSGPACESCACCIRRLRAGKLLSRTM